MPKKSVYFSIFEQTFLQDMNLSVEKTSSEWIWMLALGHFVQSQAVLSALPARFQYVVGTQQVLVRWKNPCILGRGDSWHR